MRILHISKYYFPYIGGVENICKYIADNTLNHEVAILCFNDGNKNVIDEVDGIRVYRVGNWLNISRQALSLRYFTMMKKVLREFKPDVIQFHWANPFPASILLTMMPKDVKLIVHWHMDIIKQSVIYRFIKPIETALLKRADIIVCTSPCYAEHSLPLQPFKDKIRIVPNAMDESKFNLTDNDEIDN